MQGPHCSWTKPDQTASSAFVSTSFDTKVTCSLYYENRIIVFPKRAIYGTLSFFIIALVSLSVHAEI